MELLEAPAFTRLLPAYMEDEEYLHFQVFLIANPEAGDVVPETGGFRKVRWLDPQRRKGKRGGLRILYYYFPDDAQLWLVTLYDKDQADDLNAAQKKTLRNAIRAEKAARSVTRKTRDPRTRIRKKR